LIEEILAFLQNLDPLLILLALLFAAFLENVFPPVPGDTVTVIGGALVGSGILTITPTVAVTTLGSGIGFMALYFLGRVKGRQIFENPKIRFFAPENLGKIERWFARWGNAVLFVNRFLAGTRSIVPIFAGLSNIPWVRVFILGTLSALIWNSLLITAGYFLGNNWQLALEFIEIYSRSITLIIIVAVMAIVIYRYRHQIKQKLFTSRSKNG
jgi:membrane protein DedA with SNARE-associated domain